MTKPTSPCQVRDRPNPACAGFRFDGLSSCLLPLQQTSARVVEEVPGVSAGETTKTMAREKKIRQELVTREYTVNIHKRIHGIGFKRRAPRAISELRKFAMKQMGTSDVRIHADLNKFIWSRGIRNVPRRVRVRISRKRNEDEEADNKLYALVTFVDCPSFKTLGTTNVDNIDDMDEEDN
eukprot:gene691-3992_t